MSSTPSPAACGPATGPRSQLAVTAKARRRDARVVAAGGRALYAAQVRYAALELAKRALGDDTTARCVPAARA